MSQAVTSSRAPLYGPSWFTMTLSVVLGCAVVTLAVLSPAAAIAATVSASSRLAECPTPTTSNSAPKIDVGPSTLTVQLERVTSPDERTAHKNTPDKGQLWPVVTNTGETPGCVTFAIALDHEGDGCAVNMITIEPSAPRFVAGRGFDASPLTLYFPSGCAGKTGTLIAKVANSASVTTRFSIKRDFDFTLPDFSICLCGIPILWIPIILGFVVAFVFGVALWIARNGLLSELVPVGSSWSFKDSWLTNIATLGGLLGAALAASNLLETVLPGVASDRLVFLSLLFTGMVLMAPLIFTILSKSRYKAKTLEVTGTVRGVVLAGAVTLWGVLGELTTLGMVTWVARGPISVKLFIFSLLFLGVAAVFVYAVTFTLGVTKPVLPPHQRLRSPEISGTL